MNIVFMGTPEFAVPALKRLIDEFNINAVFTQPDRPKGRGKKLAMSPVKEVALENNIKVYQPENLKKDEECIKALKELSPDFIIVVAYGQILSKEVLEIPKYGCINLHASLLPKYRGAAPINWAIVNGESESGNTTMFMDIGLDTGDMLLKSKVQITNNMTAGELHDLLMIDGSDLLVKTIIGIVNGEISRVEQIEEDSCYAPMLNKELAEINWEKDSKEINNLIRGLNPWPIAYTYYKDERMKILEAELTNEDSNKECGTIIDVDKSGIKVSTGNKVLLIKKVQFPSGKPLYVQEYIKGHTIEKGVRLK
ncbi:methionyl-tRNA formyltransferase [Clostridium sp. HMP27]|uniref:methionyl-tRNA formyltransferase n=1 Tax=Clostridium sp. HMP27 TaxID=1487921 RepID=UPI00052C5F2E|nr:methionyl-tRNA formyltransferase [Clostridium sp. HMP27]KGK88456.1 methionyl-tRNA formyltransferase [Clostridium sp. HMP27]